MFGSIMFLSISISNPMFQCFYLKAMYLHFEYKLHMQLIVTQVTEKTLLLNIKTREGGGCRILKVYMYNINFLRWEL